jgi:hypothetical protein
MPAPVRVTTDPDFYEQHPDSIELWSPGSPVFPVPEAVAESAELAGMDYSSLVATKPMARNPTLMPSDPWVRETMTDDGAAASGA